MADTNFIDKVTVIQADWANDINRLHYTILNDPDDLNAVQIILGVISATETTEGLVERSTDAEASAGIDTVRYITPKQLADNVGGGGGLIGITTSTITALGDQAGDSITTGNRNVCVGLFAGTAVTTGQDNVLIGSKAGEQIEDGRDNICIGSDTLKGTITPNGNIAIGTGVQNGSSGDSNIGIGSFCMSDNDLGSSNTGVGHLSLTNNTNGSNISALGRESGRNNITGSDHIFIGSFSGTNTTGGQNQIIIGKSAQPSSATVSNEITLGNSSIATLRCQQTTITALSDERDKKDIFDSPYGLDFINNIRPVQFTWDMREDGEEWNGKKRIGFIAQELLEATGDNNDILNLVYQENPEKLETTPGNLLPITIKAIQELSTKIEHLEEKVSFLEKKYND